MERSIITRFDCKVFHKTSNRFRRNAFYRALPRLAIEQLFLSAVLPSFFHSPARWKLDTTEVLSGFNEQRGTIQDNRYYSRFLYFVLTGAASIRTMHFRWPVKINCTELQLRIESVSGCGIIFNGLMLEWNMVEFFNIAPSICVRRNMHRCNDIRVNARKKYFQSLLLDTVID